MTEEAGAGRTPPMYASYLTFVTLLDWLREMQHLPSQFDRSWWGSKFSGSGGAQLMAGLRFLGLLDKDAPTERLEKLARATNQERSTLLADLLRDAYGADAMAGLARMTPKLLDEHLAALGTTEATHRKAVAFFVNAAKAAQLSVPATIAKKARNRPASTTRKAAAKPLVAVNEPPKSPIDKVLRQDGIALPKGIRPALVPFLDDLVLIGPKWDEPGYRLWKETFDRVLLYAYPVHETDEGTEAAEGGE